MRQAETLNKIRKNFHSFKDVWLFIQIFFLASFLPLMLRMLSLPRLMKIITPVYLTCDGESERVKDKVVKFTDYILGRNFWIYKSTCLKRSLILYHFFRKYGYNVFLCFGVKYNNTDLLAGSEKRLEGHAWLLYNENIFLEKNIEMTKMYKLTYCFPERKIR